MTPYRSGFQTFLCYGPFHCTQNRCGPLRFVKLFSIIGKLDLAFLSMSTSTALARSKFRASACLQLTSPKSNKKSQQYEHVRLQLWYD